MKSSKNDGCVTPSTSAEAIAALAESGGICPECGGLHISRIEVAIIAVNAGRESGVTIPTCRCDACETCRTFRQAVRQVMSAAHSPSTWTPG
jgi:hypothetical protein